MNNPQQTPTLATFKPEQIASMSESSRAAAAQQFIAAGHNREQIAQLFGTGSATTPIIAGKTEQPLSVAEREKIERVNFLKRHWSGNPAALETALKEEGVELAPVGTDARTGTEQAFDNRFPVTDKSDYRLQYGRDSGDIGKLAELNDKYSSAFAAMQLPPLMGQGMLDTMNASAAQYTKLDAFERQQYGNKQNQLVESLGKDIGDRTEIARLAALALSKADKAFVTELGKNGSLESAAVVIQLARQGQRLAYREQLAAKRGKK